MSFYLAQGGATLYKIDPTTGTATALTLPTGVTLATTRKPQFAVLNQWVAMVNSPSRNLVIDPEGTVRVMVPRPPISPPNVAVGSGTGLTGAYLFKESFVVLGSDGSLYMESALSPASTSVTAANQDLALSRLELSGDAISARRIYRTTAGGTTYYKLMDVDGNTVTTGLTSVADASLTLLPAIPSVLAGPPGTLEGSRLKVITSWKNRLWAADDVNPDDLYYTEDGTVYQWPNRQPIYPIGQESNGIVALAARKDHLGILKRNGVWMIAASSGSSGISSASISVVQIAFGKAGCISPESVVVVNDKAYWLGVDGIYEWSNEGVKNISNETVAPWFKTDTYFTRSRFVNAFAKYNELRNTVEFHLAAAGSSVEDRWVGFNLTTRAWYGPHKTGLFTPSAAGSAPDANGLPTTLVGGTDGLLYTANSTTARDGSATAIDMDCYGPWHSGDAPDVDHFWGHLSMLTRVESAGTLTVTPIVGRLNSAAQSAITHTLTLGREQCRILGDGPLVQLRFRKNTVNQSASLYGYEVDPVFENGRN
jgi:hypothetical protein